jgi:hypothetical protein
MEDMMPDLFDATSCFASIALTKFIGGTTLFLNRRHVGGIGWRKIN